MSLRRPAANRAMSLRSSTKSSFGIVCGNVRNKLQCAGSLLHRLELYTWMVLLKCFLHVNQFWTGCIKRLRTKLVMKQGALQDFAFVKQNSNKPSTERLEARHACKSHTSR